MRGYDYTIDYRNRFFEVVKAFDYKRSQLRGSFTLVFEGIEMKLQSPKPNFRNIAWEWNSRLNSLERQLDNLQADLVKMDTLSNFFYRQLREINKNMQDKTVREREKVENDAHEKEWKKLRAYAKRNIRRAKEALSLGRDAHKVLVSSGIRTKRETSLKTFREVRSNLFQAVRRLEKFAHSTQLFVSLENEQTIPQEIKKMRERHEDVTDKLATISKKVERRIRQNTSLQEISWEWESKYADMSYDLEALTDDFDNIKLMIQNYYEKSRYHIAKIISIDTRALENQEQTKHEAKFESIYKQIQTIRDDITKDLRFGEDAYQVLINAARRKNTEEAIAQLASIRQKLERDLKALGVALNDLATLFKGEKKVAKK